MRSTGHPGDERDPPAARPSAAGLSRALLHPCAFRTELFATEGSHLRILRVLDLLFYQRMKKESLLSREELALLFPNLPELIEIHSKPLPARILRWEQRVAHGCQGLLCCHPPFQSGPTDGITAPSSPFSLLGEIQSLFLLGSANTPVWDARRTHFWCHAPRHAAIEAHLALGDPLGQAGTSPNAWRVALAPPSPSVCLSCPRADSLSESMKKLREEGPIIKEIGDLMLSRVRGPQGHLIVPHCGRVGVFKGRWM